METNNNEHCDNCHRYFPMWMVGGLGVLLMVFLVLLIVQKGHDLQTSFANAKPANTISVSGEGKVTVTPDLATVNVGVMTQAATATDAKNQNNTKVNQVIAFVKQQGIAAADIQTQQLNLYPQQSYGGVMVPGGAPTTPKITGYQAQQTVEIKIHGVDKDQSVLEKVLDGAVNNGANEVDGVNLSVENPDALQQQAQQQAISNAKAKAQALAQTAGLTLGKVVSVSESNVGMPGPIPYAANAMALSSGSNSVAPNVQVGSQEIDETMTVTYEVK